MKRFFLLLAGSALLLAQETVSRVIQLKHVSPNSLQAVLDTFAGNRARWRTDQDLRLVVVNGPADLVDSIEAIVKKYDAPPPVQKNVELTFHLLLAGPTGDATALPADLNPVVTQLKNVFGLKSFRVLETAVLRSREGRGAETSGVMAPAAKLDANARYNLKMQHVQVTGDEKGSRIRIDNLRFNAAIPIANSGGGMQFYDAGIQTDVDIREGQKVVVGKTSVDSASQSIFLVVTGRVVD